VKNANPKVDAYIAKSAEFARPILAYIRETVHAACPDVEETMKWSTPFFEYHGNLCQMAAFKQHCAFGFWHKEMRSALADGAQDGEGAGQFGRITRVADLPKKAALKALVKQAMELNEAAAKSPKKPKGKPKAAKALAVPDDLAVALKKNKRARETFEGFSPSHRNEYVEWITEAKRDETRQKRLDQTLEWLAEGKSRHWKYR
jgi:uncharacterized protein YdeI (YjbR/CyaY-like superfamily)